MRILALIAALTLSFTATADTVQLKENAPDRHVVVKGDTLWDISAKFLKTPWKWPELWQLNKDEIKNPHLIYPGDVLYLSFVDGKPVLSKMEVVRLSPQVRSEPIVLDSAIPSVPYKAIAPFLKRTRVIESAQLDSMPYILGSNENRVMFGTHDTVFATPGNAPTPDWQVVRVGRPLIDPDTKAVLGYELEHLGDARTVVEGNPQMVKIVASEKEVLERDRLVPAVEESTVNLVPHAPEMAVDGKVITSLNGAEGAGMMATVVLNIGNKNGVEAGHVFGLFREGRNYADPKCVRAEKLAFLAGGFKHRDSECQRSDDKGDQVLPAERIGTAFVYRVFDGMAFALIMQSTHPVYPGSMVKQP